MVSKYTMYRLSGTLDASGDLDITHEKTVRGKIDSVFIDYPAGNVEIKVVAKGIVDQDIIDLSTANTDRVIYPRVQVQNSSGTNLNNSYDNTAVTALTDRFTIFGNLQLICDSGTAAQNVKVTVVVEEY